MAAQAAQAGQAGRISQAGQVAQAGQFAQYPSNHPYYQQQQNGFGQIQFAPTSQNSLQNSYGNQEQSRQSSTQLMPPGFSNLQLMPPQSVPTSIPFAMTSPFGIQQPSNGGITHIANGLPNGGHPGGLLQLMPPSSVTSSVTPSVIQSAHLTNPYQTSVQTQPVAQSIQSSQQSSLQSSLQSSQQHQQSSGQSKQSVIAPSSSFISPLSSSLQSEQLTGAQRLIQLMGQKSQDSTQTQSTNSSSSVLFSDSSNVEASIKSGIPNPVKHASDGYDSDMDTTS
jgi:hypothetical protein